MVVVGYVIGITLAMDSYDTLVAMIIGPALFVVSLPVLSRQAAREGDGRLFWLLLLGLVVKLLGAIAQIYVALSAYGGVADSTGYYNQGLDLATLGPPIERNELFPNRTNVSFWRRDADDEISARIFERGVGETMSSGTGASGAAVAAVLRGAESPVTVHLDGGDLEVEVGEDLSVSLTGWAVPVYRGELADEFLEELRAAE